MNSIEELINESKQIIFATITNSWTCSLNKFGQKSILIKESTHPRYRTGTKFNYTGILEAIDEGYKIIIKNIESIGEIIVESKPNKFGPYKLNGMKKPRIIQSDHPKHNKGEIFNFEIINQYLQEGYSILIK